MKMKFIGVGDLLSSKTLHNTSAVLTSKSKERMLIDCGTTAKNALNDEGLIYDDIDAVYITHLHPDHVGGLSTLALYSHYCTTRKLKLFIHEDLVETIWSLLRISLEFLGNNKENNLDTFFDVKVLDDNTPFLWGGFKFVTVKRMHISNSMKDIYSYGLYGYDKDFSFYYTGDCQVKEITDENLLFNLTYYNKDHICYFYRKADIIFHDCETSEFISGCHANYKDLDELPDDIKKKMYLMHYQENTDTSSEKAAKNGFAGFAYQGQLFNLGASS